jgi:malonate-semialdehyde dehydrogenase (acetylating) / methylmalonate-semialdehyde dehydrogenase
MSSHAAAIPDVQTLDNFIGGQWVKARTSEFFDVHNPAIGDVIGRTPLSTAADVDAAVQAAAMAFPAWRDTPVNTRAQVLYKVKQLMEQHFEEMARIVTTEHGKTLDEARGSVRRGIECVEVAAGAPSLMQGFALEPASTATSSASRSAWRRRLRRSTSRRWCRCGSCRSRSRPATRSC